MYSDLSIYLIYVLRCLLYLLDLLIHVFFFIYIYIYIYIYIWVAIINYFRPPGGWGEICVECLKAHVMDPMQHCGWRKCLSADVQLHCDVKDAFAILLPCCHSPRLNPTANSQAAAQRTKSTHRHFFPHRGHICKHQKSTILAHKMHGKRGGEGGTVK